jgi:glycosyltransferase involved in cell wall biosynthesis
MTQPPKIALVVQGRFHGFDLARAILAKGVPLRVFTNYPAFAASKFGLAAEHITSFPIHGVLHRYAHRWNLVEKFPFLERMLHSQFSKWSISKVQAYNPHVAHVFSGVALELFQSLKKHNPHISRFLVRGSAHIREQHRLLKSEGSKCGLPIDLPSPWMIQRETHEYQLANRVFTLSSFAHQSFRQKGYPEDHLELLPLASDVSHFRPSPEIIQQRLDRIRSGSRLKVLCTGTACLRKGIRDFATVARGLKDTMQFTWVGGVSPDAESIARQASDVIEFLPRVPQSELTRFYNDSDCFFLPTIEDGFAVVLEQAKAACLPILATTNCAAPDLVHPGVTGFVLPINQPDLFTRQLNHWHSDRDSLAIQVEHLRSSPLRRDWSAVADEFISIIQRSRGQSKALKPV